MKRSYSDLEEQHIEQFNTQLPHAYKHLQNSSSPRMKACLQCGTTRTPQVRLATYPHKALNVVCSANSVLKPLILRSGGRAL